MKFPSSPLRACLWPDDEWIYWREQTTSAVAIILTDTVQNLITHIGDDDDNDDDDDDDDDDGDDDDGGDDGDGDDDDGDDDDGDDDDGDDNDGDDDGDGDGLELCLFCWILKKEQRTLR